MKQRFKILIFFLMLFLFQNQFSEAKTSSQKNFKGITITVGVQNVSAIGSPAIQHAKTWEEKTNGKVNVLKFPFGELFNEFMNALKSENPKFDVIFYAPAWAGDFYSYLSPLPNEIAEDESFDDIHPTYRDRLMKWNDQLVAVTVDGDQFIGYYRKDLFEIQRNREEFKKKYGYELSPPETWANYRDIAEFFTGKTDSKGNTIYGASEAFKRGGQQFWDVFSRASAYTNHPENSGGQFFNPENMKAQINNPGWIRAISEYVDILKFCPPNAKDFDIVAVRKAFISGQTAMELDWGDTGPMAEDKEISVIADKVGYFTLPGSVDVWNFKKEKWDQFDKPHKAPFLAFGGWVASVPKNCKNKEAAWDYIMWYANPKNSLNDAISPASGVNPYRFTHFSNIDAWTKIFSNRGASEYLGVLMTSLNSPFAALDLRLPSFFNYTEAFEIQLTRAINKEITVKDAMDLAAQEWEKITDKLGREKQLAIYRASMGLAPK
ncbi:MAG: extracellular solute-binding protein [Desulfobacterales bacterium]|nr:extracellular solute-binding protein [Desulfobacterales bacterium]